MKITFPYWGNYTICFETFFEKIGFKVIPPEKTNQETFREGARLSPELYCFPLKVNMGNYLSALKKGADTIFMWENVGGICRFRYYWVVQQKILTEEGFKVKVLNLNMRNIFSQLRETKKRNQVSWWQIFEALYFIFKEIKFVEWLEEKAAYFRPREKIKGDTDRILDEVFGKLNKIKKRKKLQEFKRKAQVKFSKIEINKNQNPPKVSLIGEIYTVVDNTINFDLEKKLGQMGIDVHREMSISYFIKHGIFPWLDYFIQKKVNPYLKYTVGGHGRNAIKEMLDGAKKGFDGVVHLLPFGCFVKDTNITIEGYLQKPIQEIKVGEKVLTHKGRFKKVTKTFCRNYKGKILKIDCGGKLLTISVTPEHPVLLAKAFIKNHKKRIQSFDFTPAIEAEKGDFIAIPIPKETNDPSLIDYLTVKTGRDVRFRSNFKRIDKFVLKPDLLRLIGYYLAEGSLIKRTRKGKNYIDGVVFGFNINEKDYIKETSKIIKQNFNNLNVKIKKFPKRHVSTVEVYSRSLAEYFQYLCSSMADKKKLSPELLNLEPKLQKEILKGFFRGDGCFTDEYGETTYRGVTTSPNLASQLFWLLIRNRIKPSFMEQHIKNRKLSYMIKIAIAHEIKRLGDEKIKVTERKKFIKHRELKDYFLAPIRKMEMTNFNGKVYNLTVEDDHSYVANFLNPKNCMPETTVRPILQEIHKETGIPFISLSLDEQVAEAGVNTRLEAFVDVVRNYHRANQKSKIKMQNDNAKIKKN